MERFNISGMIRTTLNERLLNSFEHIPEKVLRGMSNTRREDNRIIIESHQEIMALPYSPLTTRRLQLYPLLLS